MILFASAFTYGQPCAGYPASKAWQADPGAAPGTLRIQDADGGYPGWTVEQTWHTTTTTQEHPATVDTVTAERDEMDKSNKFQHGWAVQLRYTTEGTAWVIAGGDELSFTWQVHMSKPGEVDITGQTPYYPPSNDDYLQIQLRNGVGKVELSFEENVTGVPGCLASGWLVTEGQITSGGRPIPNQLDNALSPAERYLPMPLAEWHTIRVDLHADGMFDVWIDGGGSDWKHVSGTTPSTSDRHIRFGLVDESFISYEFSTACVAWGEGDAEIPPAPATLEEICSNGNADDDDDGNADCADSDCDCSALSSECERFSDIVEHFNVAFEQPDGAPNPNEFYSPPGWLHFGYRGSARADREDELFKLPPHDGPDSSASQRLRVPMDLLQTECGTEPDCYAGEWGLEKEATAGELVNLPIDWTYPISVAMDSNGSDLTFGGKWESFITFDGYAGTGGPGVSEVEWGDNGRPHLTSSAGFVTHVFTLDLGQEAVTDARLRYGIDFDLNPPTYIPPDSTDISFFENVRILYTPDYTVPVMWLSESAFTHTVPGGSPVPEDTFLVGNLLGGGLNYTIDDGADWISVTPGDGGPLAGGESDLITVTYDGTGLVGTHMATIAVDSAGAWKSPLEIAVTLTIELAPPDYDSDGDVDQDDFSVYQACLTGDGGTPTPGLCEDYADLDGDGDVDSQDAVKFENCATAPGVAFSPDCLTLP
jgi:hypothetical protein